MLVVGFGYPISYIANTPPPSWLTLYSVEKDENGYWAFTRRDDLMKNQLTGEQAAEAEKAFIGTFLLTQTIPFTDNIATNFIFNVVTKESIKYIVSESMENIILESEILDGLPGAMTVNPERIFDPNSVGLVDMIPNTYDYQGPMAKPDWLQYMHDNGGISELAKILGVLSQGVDKYEEHKNIALQQNDQENVKFWDKNIQYLRNQISRFGERYSELVNEKFDSASTSEEK